jgi:hypothetical protein
MLDPYLRFQEAREFFDVLRLAAHREYLEAVMVVDVDMLRGYHQFLAVMLNIHELVHQIAFMMIVVHGDGPGDFVVAEPLLFNEVRPYQVPYGFRPVFIIPGFNVFVEIIDKLLFEGDAEPVEIAHFFNLLLVLFPDTDLLTCYVDQIGMLSCFSHNIKDCGFESV